MADRTLRLNTGIIRTATDDELLVQVSKTLARTKGIRWRGLRVGVHNGVVRVAGTIASADEQNRIVTVARQVPGVIQVDDHLTLDKSSTPRKSSEPKSDTPRTTAKTDKRKWRNEFLGLPVTSESLDDLLAARQPPQQT